MEKEKSKADMQVNRRLIQSLSFDNTGSWGAGRSASAGLWLHGGSDHSFSSQRKKWHLSQVQQSVLGFTSPILSSRFLLPSPSLPPLPVGKEKVGGGGGPTGHRQHCGILFLWLLPACGGQDAIGSALCAIRCLSLSNSEQERQEAVPPGPGSMRWFKPASCSEGDRREGERKSSLSSTYCTMKSEA